MSAEEKRETLYPKMVLFFAFLLLLRRLLQVKHPSSEMSFIHETAFSLFYTENAKYYSNKRNQQDKDFMPDIQNGQKSCEISLCLSHCIRTRMIHFMPPFHATYFVSLQDLRNKAN